MRQKTAKRLINCSIPISTCNLKCHYCYITQHGKRENRLVKFDCSPEDIGRALSVDRLGGECIFNLCGFGETLMVKELPEIIYYLAKQGHYLEIVTNATLTKAIDEILKMDTTILAQLEFKCSFHYLELKRLNLLDTYITNVNKLRKNGCSITVELVPNDELIPYIDELKKVCIENFGALCHLTVGRDDRSEDKHILTKIALDEYQKIWNEFDSDLFAFKLRTFEVPRKEFCYAGDWSLVVDLSTGEMRKCYKTEAFFNIYKNINEPIPFEAIGCHCLEPHCFNAHAYLTLGNIPELETPTYANMRNRLCEDGSEWLNPGCREFLSGKFRDVNKQYGFFKRLGINLKSR